MIYVLMLGIGICLIPLLFWKNKEESTAFKILSVINFILFGTIGTIYIFFIFFGSDFMSLFVSITAFFFMALSLCGIILSGERETEHTPVYNGKGFGRRFLLALGVFTISVSLWLFIIYLSEPYIANGYWKIIRSPWFVFILVSISLVVLILIILGPLSISFTIEQRIYEGIPLCLSRRKSIIAPIFILSIFFIITLIGFSSFQGIYSGKSDTVGDAGDALGTLFWTIMSQPEFIIVVVLVLVGGLAKTVSGHKAAILASNVLILWLPGFMWTLVIVGVVEPPRILVKMFSDVEFLAYLMYCLIYGVLMLAISAAISVFQSFKLYK